MTSARRSEERLAAAGLEALVVSDSVVADRIPNRAARSAVGRAVNRVSDSLRHPRKRSWSARGPSHRGRR